LYAKTDAKDTIFMKKCIREVLMMEAAHTPWQGKFG
jgi:hypothetical protein